MYVVRIASVFDGFPMPFVDCAPTAAVTDMATTAVLTIQFVLILSLSSFAQLHALLDGLMSRRFRNIPRNISPAIDITRDGGIS
jgi:hypothetical protein